MMIDYVTNNQHDAQYRLGKSGLSAARAAAKLQTRLLKKESSNLLKKEVDTDHLRVPKNLRLYYVPTFSGTYANPSRYWTQQVKRL